MKKTTLIWLCAAALLVAAGVALFVVTMTACGWDIAKLSAVKYEENTYEIGGNFNRITVNTANADVELLPSGEGSCRVVCYTPENAKHVVTLNDSELKIEGPEKRSWQALFGLGLGESSVTVYVPEAYYYEALSVKAATSEVKIAGEISFGRIDVNATTGGGECYASANDIKIGSTTGDVLLSGVAPSSLEIASTTGNISVLYATVSGEGKVSSTTGDVTLKDSNFGAAELGATSGDVSIENTVISGKLSVKTGSGDVSFDRADAAEIYAEVTTGDVTGTLLSEKQFRVSTTTGDVTVPSSSSGGTCEISTTTGDIKIRLAG